MRRARVIAVLALASCGRLDFHDLARGDGGSLDGDGTDATMTCGMRDALSVPVSGMVTNTVTTMSTDQGSCGGAATSDDVYAIDLAVTGDLLVAADYLVETSQPILYIRTDCTDSQSELACDTISGVANFPEIRLENVPAARYFVFVDGQTTGTYNASIQTLLPLNATCDPTNVRDRCGENLACIGNQCVATTCTIEQAFNGPGPFSFAAVTTTAMNLHAGSCGTAHDGGLRGNELVYTVAVASAVSDLVVSTDDPGTDFDTLVYVRSACDSGEVACDDDSGVKVGTSVAHTGPLAAGTYFVFIDGFAYKSGNANVTITLTP